MVAKNYRGNLYISWMDPTFKKHWVSIEAVMNRGTYTVNHYCPVGKAHFAFVRLGLRHLIVLGVGGRVVGILTRINLLKTIHSRADRCHVLIVVVIVMMKTFICCCCCSFATLLADSR